MPLLGPDDLRTAADAARNDALSYGSPGGVHGIIHAVLLLLDLDLRRAPDPDHSHTARQLRQALLQLLAIVVRGARSAPLRRLALLSTEF
jgi:hypothetical protein